MAAAPRRSRRGFYRHVTAALPFPPAPSFQRRTTTAEAAGAAPAACDAVGALANASETNRAPEARTAHGCVTGFAGTTMTRLALGAGAGAGGGGGSGI